MRGFSALLLAGLIHLPWIAQAQTLVEPEARQGYYVSLGLHSGPTAAENEDVGGFGGMLHNSLWLRAGEKPLPWLGVGLVLMGGAQSNDDWQLGYGGLQMEGQVEPFPDLDLAIRFATGLGGGGVSRVREEDETEDDPEFAFGPLVSAGVSYEFFPVYNPRKYDSGGFGFSIFLEGLLFSGGDVTTGGALLGVEFSWWTGLDRRKLNLPVEEAFDR